MYICNISPAGSILHSFIASPSIQSINDALGLFYIFHCRDPCPVHITLIRKGYVIIISCFPKRMYYSSFYECTLLLLLLLLLYGLYVSQYHLVSGAPDSLMYICIYTDTRFSSRLSQRKMMRATKS